MIRYLTINYYIFLRKLSTSGITTFLGIIHPFQGFVNSFFPKNAKKLKNVCFLPYKTLQIKAENIMESIKQAREISIGFSILKFLYCAKYMADI